MPQRDVRRPSYSYTAPAETSSCNIHDCLASFVEHEVVWCIHWVMVDIGQVLDGDDKVTCERCTTRQRCEKWLSIESLPPILVLHIKRFQFTCDALRHALSMTAHSTYSRSKLGTNVIYPLRDLNLAPYLSHTAESVSHVTATPHSHATDRQYDLYAVSNHSGGMGGGHYTAHCRNDQGTWFTCNDSCVTEAAERDVKVLCRKD